MKTAHTYLFTAWKKLILAYLLAAIAGFAAGILLVKLGDIQPERIFEASTKRLSYALPVFERGSRYGLDLGVLLFAWNALGALMTMSFVYTAALFDPDRTEVSPRWVRKIFCGTARMKLLCYLPGCTRFTAESLRRVFVWVMVPMLGLILLGVESGLQVSTTAFIFGSFTSALVSLVPHGLVEIPAFALAGAVAYSAHQLMCVSAGKGQPRDVFQKIASHRRALPIKTIAFSVIGALLIAGLIEAHVTTRLMHML